MTENDSMVTLVRAVVALMFLFALFRSPNNEIEGKDKWNVLEASR